MGRARPRRARGQPRARYVCSRFSYRAAQVRELAPGLAIMSAIAGQVATLGDVDRSGAFFVTSPLVGRDLDEQVEAYILACAREMNAVHYSLVLHVPATEMPGETAAAALSDAIRAYFQYRRDEEARKLQALMRDGRQALAIGIAFLFVCGLLGWIALRELAAPLGTFLDEGLLIIGWVALWRPLEILLYDWRPIRRERRVLDALGRMPVAFRRS